MSTTSAENTVQESVTPGSNNTRPKHLRKIPRAMLIILLLGILTPIGIALGYGVSALVTYNVLRNQAHDAVQHLLNVKTIFTGVKTHPTGFLDSDKLHRTQKELAAAHIDFQQMQNILSHNSTISAITTFLPQYRTADNDSSCREPGRSRCHRYWTRTDHYSIGTCAYLS